MNLNLLEILNTYGLPTALSFLFIWFYKQSADKYNSFLKETIKQENLKSKISENILQETKETKIVVNELKSKVTELQKTIMDYLLNGRVE